MTEARRARSGYTLFLVCFEQAVRCYEQSGQSDQITKVEKQYVDWQRKFLK